MLRLHAAEPQLCVPDIASTRRAIGFLDSKSPDDSAHIVAAFRRGLNGSTFIEGQNVVIEFRWAQNQYDQLPALAADLVRRRVDVMPQRADLRRLRQRQRVRRFQSSSG